MDFGNIKNVYKFLDQVLAQNMIPKKKINLLESQEIQIILLQYGYRYSIQEWNYPKRLSNHFPTIENVVEKHNEYLFIRDIITKNQQTYLCKHCLK